MAEKIRLFFAVAIPPEIAAGIATEREKVTSHLLRWINPENQHFTLHFLGEMEEGIMAQLISAGQETAGKHHPFALTLSGAGFFPDEKRPGVFWIGTGDGSDKLIALSQDLSSVLQETGFPAEDRPFLPHLTVARVKIFSRGGTFHSLPFHKLESWKSKNFGSFRVREFCLMESKLLPDGAVYQKVHSFSLEA